MLNNLAYSTGLSNNHGNKRRLVRLTTAQQTLKESSEFVLRMDCTVDNVSSRQCNNDLYCGIGGEKRTLTGFQEQ